MGRDLEIAPTKASARCAPYGISIAAEMLGIPYKFGAAKEILWNFLQDLLSGLAIALVIQSLDLFAQLIPHYPFD